MDKAEIDEHIAASIKNFSLYAKGEVPRDRQIELSEFVVKKASLISAHFLLPDGSTIIDMGCGTGEVTYALAQMNPRLKIIGLDRDRDVIDMATRLFRLPNLVFVNGDMATLDIEDNSVDGIINSNVLHHVYSVGGFSQEEVSQFLERQIRKLKVGGTMLIRDYILPPGNDIVLLELSNTPSTGTDPEQLSDADLLVRFSQTARPMVVGYEGFFIEELAPRRDNTRLFRLPHKWALEFIHRKDSRRRWERELRKEYTFFTYNDFRRELGRMGMRMVYSAPYWNPWVVKNSFKGKLQMYRDDGTPMSPPATNYFIVAQRGAEQQSLLLEERRPSQKPAEDIKIMVVRDKKTGLVQELVKRPGEYCDIIPYRFTPDGRLMLYLRGGYPRPIVNAVSRGSANIDGKRWSGHLVEPITMETDGMTEAVDSNRDMIFDYLKSFANLRPKSQSSWRVGDTYFPMPDRIDEAIEPVFIEVENPGITAWPIGEGRDKSAMFTEAGNILEIDAQSVMAAAQLGLLPDPRLEIYVLDLMMEFDMAAPVWLGDVMPEIPMQKLNVEEPEDVLKSIEKPSFDLSPSAPTKIKAVRSVFVEEGRVGRTSRALSAQDIEFVVPDDGIENIAVIMPLSRHTDNTIVAALDPAMMAVPNRIGGGDYGAMLTAPSFPLPREVRTMDDAKAFVADRFKVPLECVASLGESYFSHTGVSAQRIFPFVITVPGKAGEWSPRYMRIKKLWRLTVASRVYFNTSILKLVARTHLMMNAEHDMSVRRTLDNRKSKGFQLERPRDILDDKGTGATRFPSRVLGQRGVAQKPAALDVQVMKGAVAPSAESSKAAELAAKIGRRLVDSYSQAKQLIKPDMPAVKVSPTPAMAAIEKNVDAVAAQLKAKEHEKPQRKPEPPVAEPPPRP